jgi:hypothetical protein
MEKRLPYSCYGLLGGCISKQAVCKSIQKKNEDIHSWFRRRVRTQLIPAATQLSPSWSKQFAVKTAHKQMEHILNKMIHYMNDHKVNKGARGPKSWTPQMVAKTLGIHIEGRYDVIDVYERYLNRCIDQLIKVKHLNEWEVSLPTINQLPFSPKVKVPDTPFSDPFFGAFDR